jgi:periplasmic protein TonB
MKNFLLLFIHLLATAIVFAQKDGDHKVFEKVEIMAGTNLKEWETHIRKNSNLPDSVKKEIPEGDYIAIIKFVVDIHGNIGEISIKKDPGHGLGKKAANIIRNYKGQWTPANQCGRFVKSYKEQPIIFKIEKI